MTLSNVDKLLSFLTMTDWGAPFPIRFRKVNGPVYLHELTNGDTKVKEVRTRMLNPASNKVDQVFQEIEDDIKWLIDNNVDVKEYTFSLYVFGRDNLLRYGKELEGNASIIIPWTYYSRFGTK